MEDKNRFVIAVDGFCDENAEQLIADGVKLFPTRVFMGGVPIDPPISNTDRDAVFSESKSGENSIIPSVSAEYERFFDSILDERDGGDLLFLCASNDYSAALSAAENCMVKFYGSSIFVLSVRGKGAAVVPLLERAMSLNKNGETAQNSFAELNSVANNVVSWAILPNENNFAAYKIAILENALKFDRLARSMTKAAAFIASKVKTSAANCVYVSHAGNHGFAVKIAMAVAEACPDVKIKVGYCSPATIAITAPRAVSIGYISNTEAKQ